MQQFEWSVGPAEAGLSLQTFIKQQLGEKYSMKAIKRLIESAYCQVNGHVERFASFKLSHRDHLTFKLPDQQIKTKVPVHWEKSRILYEDDSLLVYNKPAGVTSDADGMERLARQYVAGIHLVHRLDRETTGVLLFAKSQNILNALISQFRDHAIHKTYLAIVTGIPKSKSGVIHDWLGIHKKFAGQTIWGKVAKGQGQEAKTSWKILEKGQKAALVACYPETGRTHQIRVHLSSLGHPIVGDYQYGAGEMRCSSSHYMLHAYQLSCIHPKTGERVSFKAPLPTDFVACCKELAISLSIQSKHSP